MDKKISVTTSPIMVLILLYCTSIFLYFLGGRSDLLANRKVEEAFIGMDTTYYVVTISNINHCDNIKGHLNPKPL